MIYASLAHSGMKSLCCYWPASINTWSCLALKQTLGPWSSVLPAQTGSSSPKYFMLLLTGDVVHWTWDCLHIERMISHWNMVHFLYHILFCVWAHMLKFCFKPYEAQRSWNQRHFWHAFCVFFPYSKVLWWSRSPCSRQKGRQELHIPVRSLFQL